VILVRTLTLTRMTGSAMTSDTYPGDCPSPTGISALLAALLQPDANSEGEPEVVSPKQSLHPRAIQLSALEASATIWISKEGPVTPTVSEILELSLLAEACPQSIIVRSRSPQYSGTYVKISDKNGKHAWGMKTRFTECRVQWNGEDRWVLVEFDDEMYYLGDIVIDSQREPGRQAFPPECDWDKDTQLVYDTTLSAAQGGS